jgi:hypothetical protein
MLSCVGILLEYGELPMPKVYLNRTKVVSASIVSIAVLFVCITAPISGQTSANSWGDAVDGIQLRLALSEV